MSRAWKSTTLKSEKDVVGVLLELQARHWLSRGQSKDYGSLTPSIDRGKLARLPRHEKLQLERQSIDVFRATARFFAGDGEQNAMDKHPVALMVLRHYGVPTRLLDWSTSPYVAAYFAVCDDDERDGEIWSFDHDLYAERGKEQWKRWPETTVDRSGNPEKWDSRLTTAFALEEPPDWFVALFYPSGFPRQNAQNAFYSTTARFNRCHAEAVRELLATNRRIADTSLGERLSRKCGQFFVSGMEFGEGHFSRIRLEPRVQHAPSLPTGRMLDAIRPHPVNE